MAFYYYQATDFNALFDKIYTLIKVERKTLKPQTPQTIVVGSRDIAEWLEEKFIERDDVLMGIDFLFLENALLAFDERLNTQNFPEANESWFKAPQENDKLSYATFFDFQLAVLDILFASQEKEDAFQKEFNLKNLTQLQILALVQKVTKQINEYLLHAPQAMQETLTKKNSSLPLQLFSLAHEKLAQRGLLSPLFLLPPQKKDSFPLKESPTQKISNALYLFGMPLLSAYHLTQLVRVSQTIDVHLAALHIPVIKGGKNPFYQKAAQHFEKYTNFLQKQVAALNATLHIESTESMLSPWQKRWASGDLSQTSTDKRINFLALPATYRGAEIIADKWHDALMKDNALRQEDFSLLLTDGKKQLAAFEKASHERKLSLFTRAKFFERTSDVLDLLSIFSQASSEGVTRELVVTYLNNPLVCETFTLTRETQELYITALSSANGYRSNYEASLAIYNFDAAIKRLRLGLLVDTQNASDEEIPGAAYLREFDSEETFENFLSCIGLLLDAPKMLQNQSAKKLAEQFVKLITRFESPNSPFEIAEVCSTLKKIELAVGEHEMSAAQIVSLLNSTLIKPSLTQKYDEFGICASSFLSVAPHRRYTTFFNLNEEIDKDTKLDADALPEYFLSPTRLEKRERTQIELVQAVLSPCEVLQIAYTIFDPITGAEKYPSLTLEEFKASLSKDDFQEEKTFASTILDFSYNTVPIASDADLTTRRLILENQKNQHPLSEFLLPELPPTPAKENITLDEIIKYVLNPFDYFYKVLTHQSESLLEFKSDTPRLAESSSSRYHFIEKYLYDALTNPQEGLSLEPLQKVAREERCAKLPPDGFDFMRRFLVQKGEASSQTYNAELFTSARLARQSYQIHLFLFDERIKTPLRIEETDRLIRIYLPAPHIGKMTITGQSFSLLYNTNANEYLYLSPYEERSVSVVKLYLLLALIQQTKLESFTLDSIKKIVYEFDKKKDNLSEKVQFTLTLDKPQKIVELHLEKILTQLQNQNAACFSVDYLGKNNIEGYNNKDDQVIETLIRNGYSNGDSIAYFFQKEPDSASVDFYKTIIRPMAECISTQKVKKEN
ncbi:MAG: RecBCD enzyme subunit RecC [Turneriella sp.]|nr:RecBCD enzyme subunit RecC [Turneriella sp.]